MPELTGRLRRVLAVAAVAYAAAATVLLASDAAAVGTATGDLLLVAVALATLAVLVAGALGLVDHDGLLALASLVLALVGVHQLRSGATVTAAVVLLAALVVFGRSGARAVEE